MRLGRSLHLGVVPYLGDGGYGHLILCMTDIEYLAKPNTIPFAALIHPGDGPFYRPPPWQTTSNWCK
jgi:hypothetical protein